MTTQTSVNETFYDAVVEWQVLSQLLKPDNRDFINRIGPELFTGNRQEVLRAMQLCFIEYGHISYEGLDRFMQGKVPGELTSVPQGTGDIQIAIDQAARLATKRQLRDTAEQLRKLSLTYDPSRTAIQEILDIEPILQDTDSGLWSGAQSFLGDLHAKSKGDYIYARTGFTVFDRNLGGEWKPKSLIVLAGGTGAGKTTLWMNMQYRMAKGYMTDDQRRIQTPSLFFSHEMSQADLLQKLVSLDLRIDNQSLASGDFQRIIDESEGRFETKEQILEAVERKMIDLQQLPIYIIDDGRVTLPQIVYQIRKHIRKYGVRVVAIDYLQIMNHAPTGNKNSDLGQVAQVLKDLAKRENICIILLSQINDKEGVDIIRDSGEVRAVVDVIVQLLPEEDDGYYNGNPVRTLYIGFWKNRFGAVGKKYSLFLHGPYQLFAQTYVELEEVSTE